MTRSQFTFSSRTFTFSMGVQIVIAARSQFSPLPPTLLLKGRKMVDYAEIVEKIARTFNCIDIDQLSDHEGEIAIILTKAGLLDMDEVFTEDGEFMYSELYVTPIDELS